MKLLTAMSLALVVVIVLAQPLAAQKSGVIGTVHDIGYTVPGTGSGCGGCHAPHNGSVASGQPNTTANQDTGKILLWTRLFSTQTFGVYSSPTLDNAPTEIGGATPLSATEARMYSLLCMSCHDGVTTGTMILATSTAAVGNPTNSAGLANDHPVNMSHDPAIDPGLQAVATVTGATNNLKLYGTSNTVQCASCHNVHSNTNNPFLRKANTGSALCLACHI